MTFGDSSAAEDILHNLLQNPGAIRLLSDSEVLELGRKLLLTRGLEEQYGNDDAGLIDAIRSVYDVTSNLFSLKKHKAPRRSKLAGGVARVKIGEAHKVKWYWVASWYDKRRKSEYYSESKLGAEKAKELAFIARRVEHEFRMRLKAAGINAAERKVIKAERRSAAAARKIFIRGKKRELRGLVKGVTFEANKDRYVARLTWRKRKTKKSFSVKKYGDEQAKQMATDWRRAMEERIHHADEMSALEDS